MRISDWSSDVCSSDLRGRRLLGRAAQPVRRRRKGRRRGGRDVPVGRGVPGRHGRRRAADRHDARDRKSVVEGKSVLVSEVLGGRRIMKHKKSSDLNIYIRMVTIKLNKT